MLKNELLHDPFGVETTLYGTVKNKKIPLLKGLHTVEDQFNIAKEIIGHEHLRDNMNTGTIGIVRFKSRK
ncbi:hypothetical protein G4V62_16200 [Bacillaceae bacterium SIJ1]|uniref:hypothetical protein n=1 Tax=Litoribacterium kuwaitense TaxID=1398745 RepID=UPI0013EE1897|nr:hypothetical protein [Litoribacterium kuwaitense]NGP46414.1 hypothetical protein [Litoribacterium kuwaitense]